MGPGQSDFEGFVAWVTFHLLQGESIPAVEAAFDERFGTVPPGTWGDVLTAAQEGIASAQNAYIAPLDSQIGASMVNQPATPQHVNVRFRVHWHSPTLGEIWRILDDTVLSNETIAEVYATLIGHAELAGHEVYGDVVDIEILPPLHLAPGGIENV